MFQRIIPKWYRVQQSFLILTALGVVLHELSHKEMAKEFGLNVQEVSYFQMSDGKAGYVKHDTPRTYSGMVAVSIAPFILNTAVAYLAFIVGIGYTFYYGVETLSVLEWVGIGAISWVGISAAVHAFPSSQDIGNVWEGAKSIWSQTSVPLFPERILSWFRSHNILFRIILFPIWLSVFSLRFILFSLLHYQVILSLPFLALLVLLDRFKVIGSHFAFTGLMAYLSYSTLDFLFTHGVIQGAT